MRKAGFSSSDQEVSRGHIVNVNSPAARFTPKIAALMIPALTPEKAARALVRGIERNKREVVVPLMMRLVYLQHALAPWAVEWLMRKTGYRRKD